MHAQVTYLSLFSGIGGFELGIGDRARCIGFSEIDRHAIAVYRRHFPDHRNYGDVTALEPDRLPDFDLLTAGFPCQAFSLTGKRRGFADTRGTLFFEIARIANRKKPRLLLLENVAGLLSHAGGATFLTVISTLDELGYDLQWQVLNSAHFGVPQNRERVFIVGHSRGSPRPAVFPLAGPSALPDRDRLRDEAGRNRLALFDVSMPRSERRATARRHAIRFLTPVECERLQAFPDGWTEGISEGQRYKCLGNSVTVSVVRAIAARLL